MNVGLNIIIRLVLKTLQMIHKKEKLCTYYFDQAVFLTLRWKYQFLVIRINFTTLASDLFRPLEIFSYES